MEILKKGKNNGITLVALVVTIIVLLILAGVTLNMVAGGNGILSKATKAVDTTNLAKTQEEVEMVMAELKMQYYADYETNRSITESEYIEQEINKNGGYEMSDGSTITISNNVITCSNGTDETKFVTTDNGGVTSNFGELKDASDEVKIKYNYGVATASGNYNGYSVVASITMTSGETYNMEKGSLYNAGLPYGTIIYDSGKYFKFVAQTMSSGDCLLYVTTYWEELGESYIVAY